MTTDEYLQTILRQQTLAEGGAELTALRARRDEVEKLLRESFKDGSPAIRYGGSIAKGTMIREAYDLDMTCYYGHEDASAGGTLKEIYESVERALQAKYLVERKPSALRLKGLEPSQRGLDFHIDVVPGRFTDESRGDVFLYQSSGEKERLKTNLDVHIKHVRESGVVDAIRLLKLWRVRQGLSVKHFALELLTIKLLRERRRSALEDQLTHVWAEMRDHMDSLSIEDPANPSGNDLSGLLDAHVRQQLSAVAGSTLRTIETSGWEAVFGAAEEMSDQDRGAALRRAAAAVSVPTKPWHG
jgi:hypothetical protein